MIEISETEDFSLIEHLAHTIWKQAYTGILSELQINTMLRDFYTPEALRRQSEQGHQFLLLKVDHHPAGFASYSSTLIENRFRIHKLYLDEAKKGIGLGRMMILHIVTLAKMKGGREIELNVNRENPSKEFYLHLGFEIITEVDIPYKKFILNDYVMLKKIYSSVE